MFYDCSYANAPSFEFLEKKKEKGIQAQGPKTTFNLLSVAETDSRRMHICIYIEEGSLSLATRT